MSFMMSLSHTHWHWLEFLWVMTQKEIKARYKNAFFGFLWMLLNPVLQMLVMGFVFQFFIPVQVENYFFFLFAGLLPWIFFSYTVQKNATAFVFERSLLQKASFPRESIVLSVVLANFVNLLISFGLFGLLLLIFGFMTWKMVLLPIVLFWLLGWTASISLLCSALNVKYRDINFFVQAGMPLLFYATPILYQVSLLPEKFAIFFYLNPLAGMMQLFHWMLVGTSDPDWSLILTNVLISGILSWVGVRYFKHESKYFNDWL